MTPTPLTPEGRHQRALLARATQLGHHAEAEDARRKLRVLTLAQRIAEVVEQPPKPTPEQLDELRRLLRPRP